MNREFIETVVRYCQEIAPKYGYKIISVPVAQACFESAYGTSELAINAGNIFGLKYRKNRVPVAKDEPYIKDATEQNPDGTYRVVKSDSWCWFTNWKQCVEGYYQFISSGNYAGCKTAKDYKEYLTALRKGGYWTSLTFEDRLKNFIESNYLDRYDKEEEKSMINIDFKYVDFYGKNSNPRKNPISKFTIHHMAGDMGAVDCAKYHRDSGRQASANFYIGTDGTIVSAVPEDRRAWTTGTGNGINTNDHMALTVEVANSATGDPWPISDKAYQALVKLGAYISDKYNIDLHWDGTKNGSLTLHYQFAATACPGPYLRNIIESGKYERDVKEYLKNANLIIKAGQEAEQKKEEVKPAQPAQPAKELTARQKEAQTVIDWIKMVFGL